MTTAAMSEAAEHQRLLSYLSRLDIDLRTLHTKIGAQGRLGFPTPEVMEQRLRVSPGTATPLAPFHDTGNTITLVADHVLEGAERLDFHPMSHTESIGRSWKQFDTFLRSLDRAPVTVPLDQTFPIGPVSGASAPSGHRHR